MSGAEAIYALVGAGLLLWLLTGGADLGGGIVERLAPRALRPRVRHAIETALAPIWEANHVWIIFVVVLFFTAFPRAFAVLSVAFHWPLLVALLGLVARGAAFTFRAYGVAASDRTQDGYSRVFELASASVPIALGAVLAGSASGAIVVEKGRVVSALSAGWATSFGLCVGVFTLSLCTLLATVYLCADVEDDELREHFRQRAIALEGVAGALAALTVWRAYVDAPRFFERLLETALSAPWQLATALSAGACALSLWHRRYGLARMFVGVQTALVFLGFASAMGGELILGAVALDTAGTRIETLRAIAPGLVIGGLLLVPALVWLYRTFSLAKRAASEPLP